MLRIALLLSGCGSLDGSDPTQVIAWRVATARRGHLLIPAAPDLNQFDVVGPVGVQAGVVRHAPSEAMRLTAGAIESIEALQLDEIDALVVPGGMGAVKTLCNAAVSEPVEVVEAPARLARGLAGADGAVLVIDEAVVWAAHVWSGKAKLRLATVDRDSILRDVLDCGHESVQSDGDAVVSEMPRVLSGWMNPTVDAARTLDHTEALLRALEGILQ